MAILEFLEVFFPIIGLVPESTTLLLFCVVFVVAENTTFGVRKHHPTRGIDSASKFAQ